MKLYDPQAGNVMQGMSRRLGSEDFWRLVSEENYPKLNDFALRFRTDRQTDGLTHDDSIPR